MSHQPLVYTTELEAVNTMLRYVDEQPVNIIPTSGVGSASIAAQELHVTSRQVQTVGLEFNTERLDLVPNTSDNITVPETYLRIDPTDSSKNFVQRGDKLYDKRNNTFKITNKVTCEIVIFFAFETLPEVVRNYITIKAGRKFIRSITGEVNLEGMTKDDEEEAKLNLVSNENIVGDNNFLQSPDMIAALDRNIQPFHLH